MTTLLNTCSMALANIGSKRIFLIMGTPSSALSPSKCTGRTRRRLSGAKVTRPGRRSFFISFSTRSAVTSVSTTTWNRLFSAMMSTARCTRVSSTVNSSYSGPCRPGKTPDSRRRWIDARPLAVSRETTELSWRETWSSLPVCAIIFSFLSSSWRWRFLRVSCAASSLTCSLPFSSCDAARTVLRCCTSCPSWSRRLLSACSLCSQVCTAFCAALTSLLCCSMSSLTLAISERIHASRSLLLAKRPARSRRPLRPSRRASSAVRRVFCSTSRFLSRSYSPLTRASSACRSRMRVSSVRWPSADVRSKSCSSRSLVSSSLICRSSWLFRPTSSLRSSSARVRFASTCLSCCLSCCASSSWSLMAFCVLASTCRCSYDCAVSFWRRSSISTMRAFVSVSCPL
eukprot:Unigene8861_Nuclearia_a/m.27110 Unigene8861_Nuclearia_a/g.27110  ORF Unigene8861_Nuclearia_a/g.27110 Unigene8861_Nuclearia_a/m.27110 type:complete len:400 (-) Unigene8861_Nuclearia_a:741-1940(-)